MIRNFITGILLGIVAFSIAGCSGNSEEELTLSIISDVNIISADGRSQVNFTVFEGNADVTDAAEIIDDSTGLPLERNKFVTVQAGEYYFYAVYGQNVSEKIKITAEPVIVSQFVRNVCLMEFTDASCTFCPDASDYLDYSILSRMDYVHLMAFHEKDTWASPQFPILFTNMFKLASTPAASVDMRGGLSMDQGQREKVKDAVKESVSSYPAHCGVAVSSTKNSQGVAEVKVKVLSEKSADYFLAVYVVEDGIRGEQKRGDINYTDYKHRYVVRKMISATVYGDRLGYLNAGKEVEKGYEVKSESDWNLNNTYVYAIVLDKDSHVNNMQVCLIDGGNTDYEYKQ